MMSHEKLVKSINCICLCVFIVIIALAIYIMKNDIGLIEGLNFGPGSYYYSDIPGWEKIFYTQEFINPNTNHPLLFLSLFVGWGFIAWKSWTFLDRKLK